MSQHRARVTWEQPTDDFLTGRYSRRHWWSFDSGTVIEASAAAGNVPPGFADPDCVDPEEGYVAAIASCHLLTFLWVAYRRGYTVVRYDDQAEGLMTTNAQGKRWVSDVVLAPRIEWEGTAPGAAELEALHEEAHRECFIANSVRTAIRIAPAPDGVVAETGVPALP